MNPVSIVAVALSYAGAAAAATLALAEFVPRKDGSQPRGGFSAHAACALAAGIAGAALGARAFSTETLVVTALAVAALAAVAYAGFCCDGIPVDIPLGALAIIAIASIVHGVYSPLFSAAVTGGPFLVTALIAANKRTSLRDGAVAAIGGCILGLQFGVGATLLGSVAGVISLKVAGAPLRAQSYAPYLACAAGLGIVAFALLNP